MHVSQGNREGVVMARDSLVNAVHSWVATVGREAIHAITRTPEQFAKELV